MVQGGSLIPIEENTFEELNVILNEHYLKHIYKKK